MLNCDSDALGGVLDFLWVPTILGYVVQSIGIHVARQYPEPDCCCMKDGSVNHVRRTGLFFMVVNTLSLAFVAFVIVDCADEGDRTFEEHSELTSQQERRGRSWVNMVRVILIVVCTVPVLLGVIAWVMLRKYQKMPNTGIGATNTGFPPYQSYAGHSQGTLSGTIPVGYGEKQQDGPYDNLGGVAGGYQPPGHVQMTQLPPPAYYNGQPYGVYER